MLEPPSSFPTPHWLREQRHTAQASQSGPPSPRHGKLPCANHINRSPSGENLYTPELRTFQHFARGEGDGGGIYQPDVVAIQVRGGKVGAGMEDSAIREPIYQSFQGPFDSPNPRPPSHGESSDSDGSSTLRYKELLNIPIKMKMLFSKINIAMLEHLTQPCDETISCLYSSNQIIDY